MEFQLNAKFATLEEMLDFSNRLARNSAGTSLTTVLERINTMASQEVAQVIADMQAGFETLNAAQTRSGAALDRVLATLADMPARIQAAVDEAVAKGVSPEQVAALTALAGAVQGEVAEAQAEADRLEAAAPAPAPVNPNPNPEPAPADPAVVNPDEPAPVDPAAPTA